MLKTDRGRRVPRLLLTAVPAFAIASLATIDTLQAFPDYDGCKTCHGEFDGPMSPQGTIFPDDDKHDMHVGNAYMDTDCLLCHTQIGDTPEMDSSAGTANNPGLGCIGCHEGAGLRAHHFVNGVACTPCHADVPSSIPESMSPVYYGTADTNVDDPCNSGGENSGENWSIGDLIGLDNDGDNLYDGDDPDCGGGDCPGDTNGDGQVDVTDLENVITTWGTDGQGEGIDADINDDGTVDVLDLVGVIIQWGPCPNPERACCFIDGSCMDLLPQACFDNGGAIQPVGISCADTECVNLLGACCLSAGECVDTSAEDCEAAGGTHQGVGTSCESGVCDVPENDACSGAIALEFGVPVMGSTANSNDDPDAEAAGCVDDNNNPVTTAGNWYKVTGNGNTLTATMCGDSSSYDAKLYIYCGTCDGFFCLAADDDGCGVGGGTSIVEWCSDPGQEYLVFVTGFAQSTGPYELVVNSGGSCGEPTPCQDNDSVCGFASDIAVGGSELGYDTCEGIVNGTAPDCGQGGQTAEGRWLRVIGDGTTLTVSLCNAVPIGFNSRLSVYCGPCDALQCVGIEPNNNSDCAQFTEQFSWCSFPGAEYYIHVSGAGMDCGMVDVEVTSNGNMCFSPPCVGACCIEPDTECSLSTEGDCLAAGGVFFGDGVACEEVFCVDIPCDSFTETITQSSSQVITPGNSVACNAGGVTADNRYYRSFTGLGASFEVCSVEIGIEAAASGDGSGSQPLTVRLYDSALPGSLGAPFAFREFELEDGNDGMVVTFEITGATTTGNLTVEIGIPDAGDFPGSRAGHGFLIGSNADGQSGPSYLASDACGIPDPIPTADIGFPDMHIVMSVNGN